MYNEDLLDFILNYSWIKNREKLNTSTRLEEDLYIYGDDAEEFLCDYSDRFSVDISNFNFPKYFTKEVYFYSIYKWLNRHKEKKTLTIGDLEKGILAGRLDDYILSKEKAE